MKSNESKPSIVFVQGIWAVGSSFNKVIPTLPAERHQVLARNMVSTHSKRSHD
jgi:hypothetical protein